MARSSRSDALKLAPLAIAAIAALAQPAQAAPPELPKLPGAEAPEAKPPSGADAGAPAGDTSRRGVVQVEQGGRPIAIGTVLGQDGRVITSLSGLGAVEQPEIRYADGTVVKAKVGHKDKNWDLALLIPLTGKWLDGLTPSTAEPQGPELKAYGPKSGKLSVLALGYKGRVDVRSREGDALRSVLDLDWKGGPTVPGAPVLDTDGKVVGVAIRACKESAAPTAKESEPKRVNGPATPAPEAKPAEAKCTAVTVGAPVYALRGFLMKTPADAVQPAAWLGLGGAPTDSGNVKGVRVMGLAPGSPAEKAGLKAGGDAPDTIVAVDGQPIETPEQLAQLIAKRGVGQQVKFLVFSGGKFREVGLTLRAAP